MSVPIDIAAISHAERRQAQRYIVHGPVSVAAPELTFSSDVLDISLNGAMLRLPQDAAIARGQIIALDLCLPGTTNVNARARVMYVYTDRFGVEFVDMHTRDFDVFSSLLMQLAQGRATDPAAPAAHPR